MTLHNVFLGFGVHFVGEVDDELLCPSVQKYLLNRKKEKRNVGGDPPEWKADYNVFNDILKDVRWT